MYCPKCGRELPDNGACVCQSQGAYQQPAPPSAPTYSSYPPVSDFGNGPSPSFNGVQNQNYGSVPPPPPPAYGYAPQPLTYADPPAVSALRALGSSPLMLTLCILFSAYFLSGFLSMAVRPDIGMNYYLNTPGDRYSMNLPLAFSCLLTCIGLWLFYVACRKLQEPISTAGITLIKVFFLISSIAGLVFSALFCFGLLLIPVAMPLLPKDIPQDLISLVFIILGVLGLAAVVLLILNLVFTLKTLNGIRDVTRSGFPNTRTSMYTIVLLILQSVGLALSATATGLAFFSPLIGAAATAFLAVVLLRHRKNMRDIVLQNQVSGYIPPQGM